MDKKPFLRRKDFLMISLFILTTTFFFDLTNNNLYKKGVKQGTEPLKWELNKNTMF